MNWANKKRRSANEEEVVGECEGNTGKIVKENKKKQRGEGFNV